jgi:hypothetical protein
VVARAADEEDPVSWLDAYLSDRIVAGVVDLSLFKGPRRVKKRLARKILRAPAGVFSRSRINAAYKTLRRTENRTAWRAWQGLTDEKKAEQKQLYMLRMVTVSMTGAYVYLATAYGYSAARKQPRGRS